MTELDETRKARDTARRRFFGAIVTASATKRQLDRLYTEYERAERKLEQATAGQEQQR